MKMSCKDVNETTVNQNTAQWWVS